MLAGFKDSQALKVSSANLVLLTAGFNDLQTYPADNYDRLLQSRDNLELLIGEVYNQCPRCPVIVGDVPPIDSWQWPPTDRTKQTLRFNAMIADLVNKLRTRDKKFISMVHFTVEEMNDKTIIDGPDKMAWDFVEKMAFINTGNWIQDPWPWSDSEVTAFNDDDFDPFTQNSDSLSLQADQSAAATPSAPAAATVTVLQAPEKTVDVWNDCQSTIGHDAPLVSFSKAQADDAVVIFHLYCNNVLKKDKIVGCQLNYNPCSKTHGATAVNVVLSVEQMSWPDDAPTFEVEDAQ